MTSTPDSTVRVLGAGMDTHALGVSLGWGMKFSQQLSFDLNYQGLFGSKGKSNDIRGTLPTASKRTG